MRTLREIDTLIALHPRAVSLTFSGAYVVATLVLMAWDWWGW